MSEDLNISVYKEKNNFHWFNNIYANPNYEERIHNSVLKYFRDRNIESTKEDIKNQMSQLDEQIIESIKQKSQLQQEEEYINIAESIKGKNKEITEYIDKLKQENRLNQWYQHDDYGRIYDVIQNGTYILSIWYDKKPNISWRTRKEQYEVGYTFSANDILEGEVIKKVSKKVDTKEEMIEYIEGRKKAFENYFKEEKPAMMDKYRNMIEIWGFRLDGYRLESEAE